MIRTPVSITSPFALLALIGTSLLLFVPAARAATTDRAASVAGPGPYIVGSPITFTSTSPCTTACRLIWRYLSGTRLGEQMGEGTTVSRAFATPGLKTVELRLNETCVGTSRLTCASFAYVSVFVEVAPAPLDTTPPTFTVSGLDAEATGPTTPVAYTFSASDQDDAVVSQSCTPAPGSSFPVGTTPITCTAMDTHGNVGIETFDVVVSDTTAPSLTVPGPLDVDATSPAGALVAYTASATDLVDGAVAPACSNPSGSVFAIGTTGVSCTATDAHGNASAPLGFTVHVRGAAEQLASVIAQIQQLGLREHGLLERLQKVSEARSMERACDRLGEAQEEHGSRGDGLTAAQLAWLRTSLARISAVLGCSRGAH